MPSTPQSRLSHLSVLSSTESPTFLKMLAAPIATLIPQLEVACGVFAFSFLQPLTLPLPNPSINFSPTWT